MPQQTTIPIIRKEHFTRNVIISFAVHAAFLGITALFPQQGFNTPRTTWIDLDMADVRPKIAAKAPVMVTPANEPVPADDQPVTAKETPEPEKTIAEPVQEPLRPAPSQSSILAIGMTKGFFKSIREGATLRTDIKDYYLALLSRINDHWADFHAINPTEAGPHDAMVNLFINRDGDVVNIQLVKSSGNPAYDRLIIQAIQSASPLPPLPDSYQSPYFQAPLRLTAPSVFSFS